jgi:hypothetical protein
MPSRPLSADIEAVVKLPQARLRASGHPDGAGRGQLSSYATAAITTIMAERIRTSVTPQAMTAAHAT